MPFQGVPDKSNCAAPSTHVSIKCAVHVVTKALRPMSHLRSHGQCSAPVKSVTKGGPLPGASGYAASAQAGKEHPREDPEAWPQVPPAGSSPHLGPGASVRCGPVEPQQVVTPWLCSSSNRLQQAPSTAQWSPERPFPGRPPPWRPRAAHWERPPLERRRGLGVNAFLA